MKKAQNLLISLIALLFLVLIEGIFSLVGNLNASKVLLNEVEDLVTEQVAGVIDDTFEESVGSEQSSISYVTRVVDADTIELSTGEKVRYIGINAPETKHPTKEIECFGEQANKKNKELVEGKKVRLEKDISDIDRYGRLLRYVYVSEFDLNSDEKAKDNNSEIFVNEYLVREGFATSSSFAPDIKYQDLFREAEEEARNLQKGLWGSECDGEV